MYIRVALHPCLTHSLVATASTAQTTGSQTVRTHSCRACRAVSAARYFAFCIGTLDICRALSAARGPYVVGAPRASRSLTLARQRKLAEDRRCQPTSKTKTVHALWNIVYIRFALHPCLTHSLVATASTAQTTGPQTARTAEDCKDHETVTAKTGQQRRLRNCGALHRPCGGREAGDPPNLHVSHPIWFRPRLWRRLRYGFSRGGGAIDDARCRGF